ncbi:unnamed protein product, partial [marine sediment metagenome]
TLAYAITVSNANINTKAGYNSRNRIYLKGDACAEDLTVGATKCDIVGVGSCDAEPRARITGEHTFTGSGTQMGMRFFNIEFYNDDASPIFTLTTPYGIEWHNCWFTQQSTCTNAIVTAGATATNIVIKSCQFRPQNNNTRFVTSAIDLSAVLTYGFVMENCIVEGAIALDIDSTSCFQSYVRNCLFIATTFCVDDESDDVVYANCQFISDTTKAGALDLNEALCSGCKITASDQAVSVPTLSPLITVKATPVTAGRIYYVHKGG